MTEEAPCAVEGSRQALTVPGSSRPSQRQRQALTVPGSGRPSQCLAAAGQLSQCSMHSEFSEWIPSHVCGHTVISSWLIAYSGVHKPCHVHRQDFCISPPKTTPLPSPNLLLRNWAPHHSPALHDTTHHRPGMPAVVMPAFPG